MVTHESSSVEYVCNWHSKKRVLRSYVLWLPIVLSIISLSQVSSYNLPKSKTQVPFSWINPYIYFNQSKTHYPNYKWEFGAEDNKEVNEELKHMEGSDRDRVLTLLFFFSLSLWPAVLFLSLSLSLSHAICYVLELANSMIIFICTRSNSRKFNSAYNQLRGSKSLFIIDCCNQYDLVS